MGKDQCGEDQDQVVDVDGGEAGADLGFNLIKIEIYISYLYINPKNGIPNINRNFIHTISNIPDMGNYKFETIKIKPYKEKR